MSDSQNNNPFNIIGQKGPQLGGEEIQANFTETDLETKIKSLLGMADIVLFMKGNSQFPQCGFSANTVQILQNLNVPFKTFDILSSPEIRQGLKAYSNWPTFPQLYIQGDLIGGNDIVTELFESGELQKQVAPFQR